MTGQKCPKCNQLTFFVNGNRGECQRKANIIASGKERFYEDGKNEYGSYGDYSGAPDK